MLTILSSFCETLTLPHSLIMELASIGFAVAYVGYVVSEYVALSCFLPAAGALKSDLLDRNS